MATEAKHGQTEWRDEALLQNPVVTLFRTRNERTKGKQLAQENSLWVCALHPLWIFASTRQLEARRLKVYFKLSSPVESLGL